MKKYGGRVREICDRFRANAQHGSRMPDQVQTHSGDERLLADLRAGKPSAARELYRRCFGRVRRYFLNKACQPADVEDLVSKVWVAVLDPKSKVGEARNLAAYIMGIARNLWFHYLKDQARRREVAPDVPGLEAFEEYIERHGVSLHRLGAGETTIVERNRQIRKLLNALRQLPAIYQEALELHFWEGLTYVELGQVLGTPTGTATSRVRLAKVRLYELMEGVMLAPDDRRIEEVLALVDEWARHVARKIRGASPD